VSRASADEVERLMETGHYDAVAIELDAGRFANITNPDNWAKTDLFKVLREGKAGMLMANLALSAFQQRLADQVGIEPGQEMRVAISAARRARLPLLLIDRDIGITLRRVNSSMPWYKRLTLMAGLATSVVSNEKISPEEVEALKQGDMLEATFAEFAQSSKELYVPLISERDEYMAVRLEQEARRAGASSFRG
jgi:pheromone shutdown protein TraB